MSHWPFIVAIFAGFAALDRIASRHQDIEPSTPDDVRLEIFSTGALALIVNPAILWLGGQLLEHAVPGSQGAWSHLGGVTMFGILVLGDDLTQYLWHRAAHTCSPLYTLHRAHHSARHMGVRVVFRNNVFYYVLMPGIWISSGLVHLGFGTVYAWYLLTKLSVIAAAHMNWHWDACLYRNPRLHGLAWIVERTVSTPATHSAHHGRHADDGVTHHAGNYGNMLFVWDVLFGTARITRRYPVTFGLGDVHPQSWQTELLWPLVAFEPEPGRVESGDPSMSGRPSV